MGLLKPAVSGRLRLVGCELLPKGPTAELVSEAHPHQQSPWGRVDAFVPILDEPPQDPEC